MNPDVKSSYHLWYLYSGNLIKMCHYLSFLIPPQNQQRHNVSAATAITIFKKNQKRIYAMEYKYDVI